MCSVPQGVYLQHLLLVSLSIFLQQRFQTFASLRLHELHLLRSTDRMPFMCAYRGLQTADWRPHLHHQATATQVALTCLEAHSR
jgi:hypothetical protein